MLWGEKKTSLFFWNCPTSDINKTTFPTVHRGKGRRVGWELSVFVGEEEWKESVQHLWSGGATWRTETGFGSKYEDISSSKRGCLRRWRFRDWPSSAAVDQRAHLTFILHIDEICGEALPPAGNAEKHKMKKQFNRMRQLANQTVGR